MLLSNAIISFDYLKEGDHFFNDNTNSGTSNGLTEVY